MLSQYLKYVQTDEAYAEVFVRQYLQQSKNRRIRINNYEVSPKGKAHHLEFVKVSCELFPKQMRSKFRKIQSAENEQDYLCLCEAFQLDVALKDIAKQRSNGVTGDEYEVCRIETRHKRRTPTGTKVSSSQMRYKITRIRQK